MLDVADAICAAMAMAMDPKVESLLGYWSFAIQRSLWMNMLRDKKVEENKSVKNPPTPVTLSRRNLIKFLSDITLHVAWPCQHEILIRLEMKV